MNEDNEKKEEQIPEFKSSYVAAFLCLMLYKLGDMEIISLEMLEKFDAEKDSPDIIWHAEKKAFIMKNKKIERPTIITPPKRIAKKLIRKILTSTRN